jgi:hypothetical protein
VSNLPGLPNLAGFSFQNVKMPVSCQTCQVYQTWQVFLFKTLKKACQGEWWALKTILINLNGPIFKPN